MKRFFKSLMVASCVVALAATGAMAAGQITVTGFDDNGTKPIVVTDYRLMKDTAYTVGPGNKSSKYDSSITYEPKIALTQYSDITMVLTNAKFSAGSYYLAKAAGQPAVAFGNLSSDSNQLYLDFNASVTNTDVLTLSSTDPAGLKGITMVDVKLDAGLASGTDVTIEVTDARTDGIAVADALAPAKKLYSVADGVKITLSGNDANVIDVYSDRKIFVDGSGNGDPANKSVVGVKISTNANGVLNQVDFSSAAWNLTINGNMTGVMSVQIGDKDAYTVQAADVAAQKVVLSSASNSGVKWTDGVNVSLNIFDDNGTGASASLDTRTFTYKFDDNSTAIVDGDTFVSWSINGAQVMVPVMNIAYDAKKGTPIRPTDAGTNLFITNTSNMDAVVTADFTGENDAKEKVTAYNVPIGTVSAGTGAGFNCVKIAQQIVAKYPTFNGTRFSGLFTFTAPQQDIFVDAFQWMNGNNKRTVQVYTPANGIDLTTGVGTGAWK